MRDTERERQRQRQTQAEGEATSMQGARLGTPSRVSRITPLTEGGAKPLSHEGCPAHAFNRDDKAESKSRYVVNVQKSIEINGQLGGG